MIDHYGSKGRVKFIKGCLKQSNNLTYDYGSRKNIYIVYELGAFSSNDSDPTLKNCLFGAVPLTKKKKFKGGEFGQNMLIFGLDMSSSVHIDSKKKNILVLGIGPTQGLEHALTAEKMYEIKFTVKNKKFCLNLHYNGANSYLFVNGTEIYNLKQKILKLQ